MYFLCAHVVQLGAALWQSSLPWERSAVGSFCLQQLPLQGTATR